MATIDERFVSEHNTFRERSLSFVREIDKRLPVISTDQINEISSDIQLISREIDYVKGAYGFLSDNLLSLVTDLIAEINRELLDFMKLSAADVRDMHYLMRRLKEFSHRATSISTNVTFLSEAQNNSLYKQEFEKLKSSTLKESEEIQTLKNEVKDQLNRIEETIEKFRTTNKAETEALELKANAFNYNEKADYYYGLSIRWRNYIVAVTGVIFLTSILFLFCFNKISIPTVNATLLEKDSSILYYFTLGKGVALRAFILAILIYLLKFGVKNFNANKHNETVNRNKGNSLEAAIRLMSLSPKESNTRDSILTLASKEIFARDKTGYLIKEDVPTLDLTKMRLPGNK